MKSQTAINWTIGAVLCAAMVLAKVAGMDAEPMPEPGDLTDAQHAAVVEQQREECARIVGANYIFVQRADGNTVCRDGSLK